MGTPAEDEERERIRKAHENVEKWKEKYTGVGGFSGGYRIVAQTNLGIVSDSGQRAVGDRNMAKKIIERDGPDTPVKPPPPPSPPPPPPVVQVEKPPFLKWIISLFSREKKS